MPVTFEQFVQSLSSSGLMNEEDARRLVERLPDKSRATVENLAKELVFRKKLTKYQAKLLYHGKAETLLFGNYLILDKLGAGGMGQVFKAEHRRLGRVVALKMLPNTLYNTAHAIRRFRQEIKAAAKLTHVNIVSALDADEVGGVYFLVMEYVEGADLARLVMKHGPFKPEQAVDYTIQAARGLAYAHEQGIIHRDIKPANLLLDPKGTVKVLDLGLARINESQAEEARLASGVTHSGNILGTVDFMAPEQALNSKLVDGRADIYGLGCTLHYLLTGNSPYEGESVFAKLLAHRESSVPSLQDLRDDVSEALDMAYQRMLAKRPEERQQSMAEVVRDLEACQERPGLREAAPSVSQVPDEWLMSSEPASSQELTDGQVGGFLDTPLADSDTTDSLNAFRVRERRSKEAASPFWLQWKKRLLLGGGVAAALLLGLVAYLLFFGSPQETVEPGHATVLVEVDQADAEICLDGTKVGSSPSNGQPVSFPVAAGPRELKVAKPGFRTFIKSFTAEADKTEKFVVRLQPLATPPVANPNRVVALMVLQLGGQVRAIVDGQEVDVSGSVEIPASLQIVHIGLANNGEVTNGHLKEFKGLNALRTLDLGGAPISDEGVEHLKELKTLQGLSLARTKMTDAGMKHLRDLTALRELYLHDVPLTDAGIDALQGMKELVTLHLHNTQITGAALQHLKDMIKMQSLSLSNTRVGDAGMEHLQGMTGLQRLWLNGTQVGNTGLAQLKSPEMLELSLPGTRVTDGGLEPLKAMTKLQNLNLSDTQVSEAALEPLQGLTGMQLLWLSRTRVADPGLTNLQAMTGLGELHLDGTKVADTGLGHLKNLTNLRVLSLQNTQVGDEGLQQLKLLTNLQTLNLDKTKVTDAGLAHLKGLMNLNWLSLNDTQITGTGFAELKGLANLRSLSFHRTPVTDAGLEPLKEMKQLQQLFFDGTKATEMGIQQLRMALPDRHIQATVKPPGN